MEIEKKKKEAYTRTRQSLTGPGQNPRRLHHTDFCGRERDKKRKFRVKRILKHIFFAGAALKKPIPRRCNSKVSPEIIAFMKNDKLLWWRVFGLPMQANCQCHHEIWHITDISIAIDRSTAAVDWSCSSWPHWFWFKVFLEIINTNELRGTTWENLSLERTVDKSPTVDVIYSPER